MDTDALLAATYRGDTRAFESLVRSQAGHLHRIASRVTGDGSLADDVLQETFLRVLRVPAAARPSRAAAAWLARVTVRVALNILDSERARRRREERYAMERNGKIMDGAPSGSPTTSDLEPAVAEALASLSPQTRAALWLHVVEGESVREVAVYLDSSRSAVSRRIRAGIEAMRARLAKSGLALAGTAALRGVLRGSETPPSESLVQKILDVGGTAMAAGAASRPRPDALDAALAAPIRFLPSFAAIGAAAVFTIGVLAALGWLLFLRPGSDRGGETVGPIATAPVVLPANDVQGPKGVEKAIEPAPSTPVAEPAGVGGTIRNEKEEPIAFADVYLAMTPPRDEDILGRLSSFFRADHFKRSRFLQTKTDGEGRYVFMGIREFGEATLGAFKEDYSGALKGVNIDEGAAPAEIDLVMAEGKTLSGRVCATDGSPVADAVVSVYSAWTPTDHIFWPAGLGPTDANGRFRLGFEARAAGCHLRVNSDRHGQHFFIEVPVTDEAVELTFKESAQVKGTITWEGGAPASGLTVRVNGRLPEPPIPVSRMGIRPFVVHDGLVGGDGTYIIEGLHPQLTYDIFIIDGSLGEEEARKKPLTPSFREFFRLDAGEVKVWDHAVQKPITVRGHIRTETTGTPLSEGQVGVRKDGKRLALMSVWADSVGFFEMRLTTGPGEYRVHAEPPVGFPSSEEVEDLIDARFGQTLHLSKDEEVEVDLTIFEPAVVPLRVLDHAGEPVKTVNAIFHATFPDGRKLSHDAPLTLDDTGRTSFLLYYPAAEFWYEIGALRGGPTVETPRHASVPGTALPEETVVLPRTCDLRAALLDASGNAQTERRFFLHVAYEDGSTADFGGRTDKGGELDEKGCVRAAPLVLELRSEDSKLIWKSGRLDGSSGEVLDLGKVVLNEADH